MHAEEYNITTYLGSNTELMSRTQRQHHTLMLWQQQLSI